MATEKPGVQTPCSSYNAQAARWAPCVALMGGTVSMREAERTYLPQFAKESDQRYYERLNNSVLYGAYGRTVSVLSGRPMGKPVQLAEGANQYFEEYAEDVDGAGGNLTTFARELLADLLVYGRCHILVDYPNTDAIAEEMGRPLTLKDAQDLSLRSFWVRVKPSEIIGWRGRRQGRDEILDEMRLKYSVTEVDPDNRWGDRNVERVVVWTPNEIGEYRKDDSTGEWALVDMPWKNTLGKIPLVSVYANRQGLLDARPPLEALAWLNVKHWQNSSDQDQIERMARVPLLFMAGFNEEEMGSVEIGPFKAIGNRNADAKVQIIEPRGDAVRVGRDSLTETIAQMEDMALEPMRRKPGNPTATELSLEAGRNVCDLEAYAMLLENGLDAAFGLSVEWDKPGAVGDPDIKISQDYGFAAGDKDSLAELRQDLALGVIDRRTYLWERQRRGLYTGDMDIDDTLQAAEDESAARSFAPGAAPPLQVVPKPPPAPPPQDTTKPEAGVAS